MKPWLLIVLIVFSLQANAQRAPAGDVNLDHIIEEIFSGAESDLDYSELYEVLLHHLSNPLDLNKATSDQLRSLMLLKEEEVNSFLNYRTQAGPLLAVYELQSVPGWTSTTITRIIPFVTVSLSNTRINGSLFKRIASEKNNYLVVRHERTVEQKKGYASESDSLSKYAGSPDKLYMRYKVSRPNDFSLGLTAEKDPGEPLVWKPASFQPGFDFLSLHFQVMGKGRLENLIVGDFQCQFGQGLQLGSVYGMGKNSETITTIRRSNLGFVPYTSVNESLFLRGLSITWRLTNQIRIHAFGSTKKIDGVIDSSPDNEPIVSSLSGSGLHRTIREIKFQNQVTDLDGGLVLQFRHKRIDAGIIAHQKKYGQTILPRTNAYNQQGWQGNQNTNAGAYFNASWSNLTFFSETAFTVGHGSGIVAGLLGNFTHQLEMAWLYRKFSKDYRAPYANAFSESTSPQNEEGVYWGTKYTFNKIFSVSAYLDIFQFPWLRYRIYRPSEGYEWLLRVNYAPSRSISFFVQVREETKVRNLSDETVLYQPLPGTKKSLWINCDISISEGLTLKSRLQGSEYIQGNKVSRGVAFIQDISFSRGRWSVACRYALFDTDNYDNRQYVYERDVWLTASLPAYDGTGFRNYVLLHYKVSQKIDCWVRWARTRYLDREAIGSGPEQIDGNTRNDTKFQVRIRF